MTEPNENCLFCRIARGEIPAKIVHTDEDVIAFEDINPQAPVHILVIPRRHIPMLADLTATDEALVGKVVHSASTIARERNLEDDGYRLVINNGEGAGQSVFHIHAHLLGGRMFAWPPG